MKRQVVPWVTAVLCYPPPSNIIRAVPGDAGHADAAAGGAATINPPPSLRKHAKVQCVSSNPCTPQHGIMEHSDIHLVHCGGYHRSSFTHIVCSVALEGAAIDVECPFVVDGPSLVAVEFSTRCCRSVCSSVAQGG